jgi:CTP synthase (UTP-ammonia lyase)
MALAHQPARIALVGDRSPTIAAHERIPTILEALGDASVEPLDAYWLHSTSIDPSSDLTGFDGIWVLPGSPYENVDGILHAITTARTHRIPFLGTCGGFQHMLLEFARNVSGLDVEHAEEKPDATNLLLVPLSCSLLGEEDRMTVLPGTLAALVMGAGPTTERYFCSYGLNTAYLSILQAGGLIVSGRDDGGEMRLGEIADHPFYLGSLFQPELSSSSTWVHPILRSFAAAVRDHASRSARGAEPAGNRSG